MSKEVSKEFSLKPEEAVVMSAEKVGHGNGPFSDNNDLTLTNQAIIHIRKDIFGKVKEVTRHPLADICMSGGKPQAVKNMLNAVNASLDVYFNYGVERFKFSFGSEVDEWVASITETVTGEKVERKSEFAFLDDMSGLESLAEVAETVTGSVNSLKKAFGIKSTEQGACKCSSCGASLTGTEDEVVICPYCGTHNKISL